MIYLTAARTGLRQEELRQLNWGDVRLDANPPCIVVRPETAKNKKEDPVVLVADVVTGLRRLRPTVWRESDLVFPQGIPRASRLKVDLARSGIAYQDAMGRYADFHALRHPWATFMQRHGVSLRFAMKQMRHSDVKLTAKVYTDEMQLPIYESIKSLPSLWGYTQIRAQIPGVKGQSLSQNGAVGGAMGDSQPVENGSSWRLGGG